MATWEDVKNKTDIVQFLGQHIKLMPSGRSFKGLCPFHKEKTPSFFVSPDKQIWHCFGCQKGGDVFRFVMEFERVEFGEALRILADKAGIVLKREDPQITTLKTKVYNALEEAAKFFIKNLSQNKNAFQYVSNRGIKPETVAKFRLGYAPFGWHGLYLYLRQLGFGDLELEQAGLVLKSSQSSTQGLSLYDRFRNRIIFPITDHTGRIVGFSGRVLPSDDPSQDQGAKYINTPDTMVYSKSKLLFGFSETKDAIKESERAFLVEGNMDMIMGWQNGIKNIVAVSGTALTEDQLIMLKRVCDSLFMNFDMDTAGEMATDRSIALASTKGFSIQIVQLPEGKDLADYCLSHPNEVPDLTKTGTDIMAYYFSRAFQLEPKTIEDKKRALAYLLPRIKVLPNVLDRNMWLEKLSDRLGIERKMLFEEFRRVPSLLEYVPANRTERVIGETLFTRSRWDALAETILALGVRFPEYGYLLEGGSEYFPYRYREYLPRLIAAGSSSDSGVPSEDQEFINYISLLAEYELSLWGDDAEKRVQIEMQCLVTELKKERIRHDIRDISVAIQEAEHGGNAQRIQELTNMLQAKANEMVSYNTEQ